MLRAVAFQNFIKFRDHQSLEFHDGPNFIVGPNASGKSAIFELIRRCLSNTANSSHSTVADTPAFVICKFEISQELSNELPKGCHVYSCVYIKHWGDKLKEMYKLVCITKKGIQQDKCYLDHYPSIKDTIPLKKKPKVISFCKESTELSQELDGLIKSKCSHGYLDDMIQKMMGDKQQRDINTKPWVSGCETILQAIHDAVVVTFPIRSPGPIQWSHSGKIGKGNYVVASTNAEILQHLLQSDDVDEEESKHIFQTIIHPLKYDFKKKTDDSTISTITVNDGASCEDIRFLKVPEGIIEAKQFSLMFAHRTYQTLVLEEPDRSMHPHMIQKLRDLVLRTCTKDTKGIKDQRKVLLLTTHQTAMFNQWSMSRMFFCRRTRHADGKWEHHVFKLSEKIENIYKVEDILKEMLFSEAVLFVEGTTDKKVILSVFDRVLEAEDPDQFPGLNLVNLQKIVAKTQVISIHGCSSYKILENIGNKLEVPCSFLFDSDVSFDCSTKHQTEKTGKKERHSVFRFIRNLLQKVEPTCTEDVSEKPATQKVMDFKEEQRTCTEDVSEKPATQKVMDFKEEQRTCTEDVSEKLATQKVMDFKEEQRTCTEDVSEKPATQKVMDFKEEQRTCTEDVSEKTIKEKLYLTDADLKNVKLPTVVTVIKGFLLPERFDLKKKDPFDLQKQDIEFKNAKKCRDFLRKKKSVFLWDSGNLEDMICKSVLEAGQESENLLKGLFLGTKYRRDKNPVKETLMQMDIEMAQKLSTCLLKSDEMKTFLEFLSCSAE